MNVVYCMFCLMHKSSDKNLGNMACNDFIVGLVKKYLGWFPLWDGMVLLLVLFESQLN